MTNSMSRVKPEPLKKFYNEEWDKLEIGIDEAGRGPLFGRVYTAAVILPKDDTFKYEWLKDSKKFSSQKKILEVANYIKENALDWNVTYNNEKNIDKINIRQSVLSSMHDSIRGVMKDKEKEYLLLVDGNDFKPYIRYENELFIPIDHQCIEGGDNKYCSIAAASILAKTERDKYIEKLCDENPELKEKYGIHKNKGYGTREHLMGISNHGITEWHRKTYGVCKFYT
jgi:ribonuclease HII|uniref:Ribonuclease HII n=1 Tax=viral metagenome TaxID=1070528 RepID=A0A6C0CI72_9ZZZZ